jgi:hypothetical protein
MVSSTRHRSRQSKPLTYVLRGLARS